MQPVLGPLFFGLFILLVYLIVVNLFVSLVTECYEAVRAALEKEEQRALERGDTIDVFGYLTDLLRSALHIRDKEKEQMNEEVKFAYIAGLLCFFYILINKFLSVLADSNVVYQQIK